MKKILVVFICVIGILVLMSKHGENVALKSMPTNELIIFTKAGCPHCHDALDFVNNTVRKKHPELKIQILDVNDQKNLAKLLLVAKMHRINREKLGTPVLMMNGQVIVGWQEKNERKLLSIIKPTK